MAIQLSTAWTNYDNTAQPPVILPGEGVVRLVPRHLDAETVERAQEWAEYHDDPDNESAIRHGDEQVENEQLRRWDDYVAACTPTLTSREEALQVLADLARAIDVAFPTTQWKRGSLLRPLDGAAAMANALAGLASR
jgi:hypothetical protein